MDGGMGGLTMLRKQVADAVGEGADLHEVEERVIEGAPLDDEGRDALWLYAWGLLERDDDRPRFQRSPRR
jgi:gluconate kinase